MKKNRLFEDDWKQCNDEAKMAKIQLKSIQSNIEELLSKIDSCDQIDAWVQSYLTKAEDYLDSVRKYVVFGEEAPEVIEPIPVEDKTGDLSSDPLMPSLDDFDDDEAEPMDLTAGAPEDDELTSLNGDEETGEETDLEFEEPDEESEEEPDLEMPSLDNFEIHGGEAKPDMGPSMIKPEEEDELSFDDLDFFNSGEESEEAEELEDVDLEDFKNIEDEEIEDESEEN